MENLAENAESEMPEAHNDTRQWLPREKRTVTTLLAGRLRQEGGPDGLCRVRNLSSGGMMIELYHPIQVGALVALELRNGMELAGRVAWTKSGRAGISFTAPVDLERLFEKPINGSQNRARVPRAPRFDANCPIILSSQGQRYAATLVNLSQSGARILLTHPLEPGTVVLLSIPGLSPIHAGTRWLHGGEAGLSFVELPPFHELAAWLMNPEYRFSGA